MADFKDVTAEVIKRLNKNIPQGDGRTSPSRLADLGRLKTFDEHKQQWKPLYNPQANSWLTTLAPNPIGPFTEIASKPQGSTSEAFYLNTTKVTPDTEIFILEIQTDMKPKLFAVSYPKTLGSVLTPLGESLYDPTRDHFDFLVFFRPLLAQRVEKRFRGSFMDHPGYYLGYENLANDSRKTLSNRQKGDESFFYPYGWDYLFFTFWHYLNFSTNPLIDPFFAGLPNQIAAANKNCVLVVPLLSSRGEADKLADPFTLLSVLTKIQKYIMIQKLNLTPKLSSLPVLSALGTVALSAFSSGNEIMIDLLNKLNFHSAVEEVYMFDAPYNPGHDVRTGKRWIDAALKWSRSQHNAVIRVYTQTKFPNLGKVVSHAKLVDAPILNKTVDGRRSVVYMPDRGWKTLFGEFIMQSPPDLKKVLGIPPQLHDPQQIGDLYMKKIGAATGQPLYNLKHAWFPAFMLTDALRRSRFR